jgi:hypothetical protein
VARNITLTLDEDILRAAKLAAARRGTSLSALLREQITALAEQDERYETAKRAALEWMEHGASLGVGRRPTRDELHDRDALR